MYIYSPEKFETLFLTQENITILLQIRTTYVQLSSN